MMDRSLVQAKQTKSAKRAHDNDAEKEASPPKLITPKTRSRTEVSTDTVDGDSTPRTRSRARESNLRTEHAKPQVTPETRTKGNDVIPRSTKKGTDCTPRTPSYHVVSKLPRCVEANPAPKTPSCVPNTVTLQKPASRTKRCRSISPAASKSQVTRSRSNTPVVQKNMSKSKGTNISDSMVLSELKCPNPKKITNAPEAKSSKVAQNIPKSANRLCKENKSREERSMRTPQSCTYSSPGVYQTPKGPRVVIVPKSQILDKATPDGSTRSRRRSGRRTSGVQDNIKSDCQTESNTLCSTAIERPDIFNADSSASRVAKRVVEQSLPDSDSEVMCSPGRENPSSSETDRQDCTDEVQKEMEKVKKRRSTLGRGRSGVSLGGRRSLCPTVPMLSLEDQVSNIDKNLPQTSKVSHLIDISLREAMRRVMAQHGPEDCMPDLRLDLITNSENVGGHVAFQIAGMPLEVDKSHPSKLSSQSSISSNRIEALRARTKKLEEEYRCWKSLLKERKLACQVAKREYREAETGETKIEDDNLKNLTSSQRSVLSSKPNYFDYIKEVQVAREKAFFAVQEIKHTANVISNFFKATDAAAESSYAAIEEMTFGKMDSCSFKSTLKSLMTLEEIPSN